MCSCSRGIILVALVAGLLAGCGADEAGPEFDVILEGGTVYDGSPGEGFAADVGIARDRITAVGSLAGRDAALRLDVSGLAVMPGIIDIHNHAIRPDASRSGIYLWPDAENLVRQGVTSVIGGPDGWSPLPIEADFRRLEASPAAVNFGTFVGHGTVREEVMGFADRPATEQELAQMESLVDAAMRAGAFGLSSGLLYVPGSFAPTGEIVALARVVRPYGGIYISHMRNEALGVHDSIRETLAIGASAGVPVQVTHHKVMGQPMWGRSDENLALIDEAIKNGLDVTSDQYPYTASSTGLRAVFPRWSLAGGTEALEARLADPAERARIREGIVYSLVNERGGNDPARVVLANCSWNPDLNGLDLEEVLAARGMDTTIENAAELIMELQVAGGCICVYHAMAAGDVDRIMVHPRTMIASDGGIMASGPLRPHPRNYGTFARVLGHYVRERGLLPLPVAIHKMTGMVAARLGLDDRGRIAPGAVADIAVFDPETIIDRATFEDPHQYAEGVRHVFVNGVAVLLDGKMTAARPGQVLRSN